MSDDPGDALTTVNLVRAALLPQDLPARAGERRPLIGAGLAGHRIEAVVAGAEEGHSPSIWMSSCAVSTGPGGSSPGSRLTAMIFEPTGMRGGSSSKQTPSGVITPSIQPCPLIQIHAGVGIIGPVITSPGGSGYPLSIRRSR